MLSNEERILRGKKKKKILTAAVLIFVGAFMITGITLVILSGVQHLVQERRWQELEDAARVRFVYPADTDWDRNIFEESAYMGLDRTIRYSDGVTITVITEENKESYPVAAQFMYDVVFLIKHGDYEAYNDIFAEEYWQTVREEDLRLEFPMQPLYNIEIQIVNVTDTHVDVKLEYRIHRNDGMFRNDLSYNDGDSRPVVYRLITVYNAETEENEIKVLRVMPYSFAAQIDFE